MSANNRRRGVGTLSALAAMILVCAACGSDDGATPARTVTVTASASTSTSAGGDPTASENSSDDSTTGETTSDGDATTAPAAAGLPAQPPTTGSPSKCAGMKVAGSGDITHPSWGPTRVFAMIGNGLGPQDACLIAVDGNNRVRWSFVDGNGESRWGVASPATDSTGNLFVTYNPGRYDGVIVLHPTASGFAPIGTTYSDGPFRYYHAELQGPGASGQYTIKQSNNDCNPACANGTITSKILRWNGTDYVG
ncbi:hypothetical protein [Williamsia sp. M5A3_1d]